MSLGTVPTTIRAANDYVRQHHRHHRPVHGALFALGVSRDGDLCGVAIVGRPVSRMLQDGRTCEVVRLCTDGTRNASSFLLGAAWRAARALGWGRMLTYTLPSEGGASLRGAGWREVGEAGGGSWSRPGRPRNDGHPLERKIRWEVVA